MSNVSIYKNNLERLRKFLRSVLLFMNSNSLTKSIVALLYCCVSAYVASAQLTAGFTIDKTGGCSPLTVKFTNTTTGASSAAIYKWDLGNGNTSGLPSPGATYIDAKTYTVTLTVTDGSNTSTKTEQLTVYKNPVVDFSASTQTGCTPVKVSFTSLATAGDGTISSYFWDFGDGQTQLGSNFNQTTHIYTFAQTAGVGLTITNSHGCYSSLSKPAYITVFPAVTASFSASQTALCKTNSQVDFTNSSMGPGTLSYLWDFGDGQTSTSASPSHIYTAKGVYTVKLTNSSSTGCTASSVKTSYINVASFKVDFAVQVPLCTVAGMKVADTSTSGFTNNLNIWQEDGKPISPPVVTSNTYAFYFNDTVSHTITLTHSYGSCSASKTQVVKANVSPVAQPFIAAAQGGACTPPIVVNLIDTANDGGVKWEWYEGQPYTKIATGQKTNYTFNSQASYNVLLKVTNAAGCSAFKTQAVNLVPPNVAINVKDTNGVNASSGCTGSLLQFSATPADEISTYQWNFGDGSAIDTSSNPYHLFTVAGTYTITLNYVTTGGCAGSVTFQSVVMVDKPLVTFSALPDSVVCGNTPITFTVAPQLPGWSYSWGFGDKSTANNAGSTITHQYYYDSVYTVTLVLVNQGCKDSIVNLNYITVKPDFPKISSQANTCNGTRGQVTFGQSSNKVTDYIWDFGDGTNKVTYNTKVAKVSHTYTKTGIYNVVLTGINGSCSVGDSVTTFVLLKQNPVLSSSKSAACSSDTVSIMVNNMEVNPGPIANGIFYNIQALQYGDFTPAPFPLNGYQYNTAKYSGSLSGLNSGENQLRFITQSNYFNCYDTTNFIPLRIHGPKAGFKITENYVCFNRPIVVKDTSVPASNAPIKTWLWSFGDGTSQTYTNSQDVSHLYAIPGKYPLSLKVTDVDGCTNISANNVGSNAQADGPKANFTVSQNSVLANTTVYFKNISSTYNAYSITYTWLFPDGSTSQNFNSSYVFTKLGADTVKLIASNNLAVCIDTAVQVVYVGIVNTAFTYSLSYINNNNCPPVIVTFKSQAKNASRIYWNFGDGSQGGNQTTVNHTYNKPGVYQVTLYGYDANNNLDSTIDYVTVKGPYAILAADKITGCDSLTVQLSAAIKNAASFTWDFGDGTVQASNDAFSQHQYRIPGIYTPQLILKDSGGCEGTSALVNKIVIDSLSATVAQTPGVICDSTLIYFTPATKSITHDQLQLPLQYHWYFGTGNVQDTSNDASPLFKYHKAGRYGVVLTVKSPYGCVRAVNYNILAQLISKASITGPTDICESATATFNGAATNFSDSLGWQWQFYDNNKPSQVQGPVTAYYKDTGTYQVTLIVNNNGCYDTAYNALHVHGLPKINILPQQPSVCLGKAVQLFAHDAQTFLWGPVVNISDPNSASPFVSPAATRWYFVKATNVYGCVANDSVLVTVNLPIKLKTDSVVNVCVGNTAQFNVSGADTYKWIAGAGLSNSQIPNPMVTTTTAQNYTVVGYDKAGCFTDTATIQLVVKARPSVTVTPRAVTIVAGTSIQLNTQASIDVLRYAWQPADYLSCANCPNPVSLPMLPVVYTVTVTNGYGCTATDTAKVDLLCTQDRIYVPNAFTPNNDNINDRFLIKGYGIRLIKHLVIFGRLGEKVFEKSNIGNDDTTNSWDGTLNGTPQPAGVYVYMAQIMCATGVVYDFKGTVTLVR